eukprot:6193247-Pleurochrysis_carterae.AAC.1
MATSAREAQPSNRAACEHQYMTRGWQAGNNNEASYAPQCAWIVDECTERSAAIYIRHFCFRGRCTP